jgi:hypothetical protein
MRLSPHDTNPTLPAYNLYAPAPCSGTTMGGADYSDTQVGDNDSNYPDANYSAVDYSIPAASFHPSAAAHYANPRVVHISL